MITEVVDADQSPVTVRLLDSVRSVAAGRIVAKITPSGRPRPEYLASALSEALGKDPSLGQLPRGSEFALKVAEAWLVGEQITDLFVIPFDDLHPQLHATLFSLAERIEVNLWLVRYAYPPEG